MSITIQAKTISSTIEKIILKVKGFLIRTTVKPDNSFILETKKQVMSEIFRIDQELLVIEKHFIQLELEKEKLAGGINLSENLLKEIEGTTDENKLKKEIILWQDKARTKIIDELQEKNRTLEQNKQNLNEIKKELKLKLQQLK